MIIDGRSIPDGETVEADLCVVGCGPAGSAIARSLSGTDLRVCVLESGGQIPDPDTADLANGANVGHPYFALKETRARAIGGSSHLWEEYLRVRPLDPIDLERRPGLPWSGWPLEPEDLAGYYAAAHELLNVGSNRYDPASWDGDESSPLPLSGSLATTTVFRYTNSYDLTARGFGLEQSANVMIVTMATANEVVEESGTITEIRATGLEGPRFSVRARAYVLAAGGIENPRLLLTGRTASSGGIGNEHDLVGRFFMEHLHVRSAVFRPSAAVSDFGFYLQHADDGGASVRGALVPAFDVLRHEGLLNSSFLLLPSSEVHASDAYRSLAVLGRRVQRRQTGADAGSTAAHLAGLARRPASTLRAAAKMTTRRTGPAVYQLAATAEQAPDPDSRVTLGATRDRFGVPRPVVDWRLGELERRSIRRAEESIDAELRFAGLGRLDHLLGNEQPRRILRGHWHHLGTTRMDDDPRRGVVDRHGRVHGVGNLYVAGGSIFPTGGYANPTLTIVALSLRLGEHLAGSLGPGMGAFW